MMANPTYPVTIDTIGKLIDHEMIAFMWCPSCQRSADIDLEGLAERVGGTGISSPAVGR
jgi:hypothetical protein